MQCRTCGDIPRGETIHIFKEEGQLRKIPEKIFSCLPIVVTEDDLFSKILCIQCATQLDNFYNFQEKSKESEERFKIIMNSQAIMEPNMAYIKEEPQESPTHEESSSEHQEFLFCEPLVSIKEEGTSDSECGGPSNQSSMNPQDNTNYASQMIELDALRSHLYQPHLETGNKMKVIYQCAYCNLNFSCFSTSEAHIRERHLKERQARMALKSVEKNKLPTQVPQADKPPVVKTKTTTMFRCTYCKLMFTTREASASHILEAHKKEREERFALSEIKQNAELNPPTSAPTETLIKDTPLYCKELKKDVTVYRCKFCNILFASLEVTKAHIDKKHKNELSQVQADSSPQFKCDYCNNKFTTKEELSAHDQSCWIPKLQKYKKNIECGYCSCKYSDKKDVEKHILKSHLCLLCGKIYNEGTGSSLRYHKQNHEIGLESRKKKICNVCGARFVQTSNLVVHMRRHTGEKPFLCHLCPNRYTSKPGLRKHLFLHSGVKDYKCSLCDKTFACAEYLKVHSLTHTGEKPYMCDVCGKCFTQQSALGVHRKVHKKDNLTCDKCGIISKSRIALLKHMRTHLPKK